MDFLTQEIDAFADTLQLCELAPTLKNAIKETKKNQEIILADQKLEYPVTLDLKYAQTKTVKSVVEWNEENGVVFQFISPVSPAKNTTLQQVEDIACDSTIYPCLTKLMESYFDLHESLASPYNNDCIYSPSIIFLKANGKLVGMPKWKKVAVISASLPDQKDEKIIEERLERMIEIARMHMHTSILINTIQNEDLTSIYDQLIQKHQNDFFNIDLIQK